jgi:hypothetical protein
MVIPVSWPASVGSRLGNGLNDRWMAWSYLWTVIPFDGIGLYAAGWIGPARLRGIDGGRLPTRVRDRLWGGVRLTGSVAIIVLGLALAGGPADRLSRKWEQLAGPPGPSGRTRAGSAPSDQSDDQRP